MKRHPKPGPKSSSRRFKTVALSIDLTTGYGRQKMQGVVKYIRANPGWNVLVRGLQPSLPVQTLLRTKADGYIGEFYKPRDIAAARNLPGPVVNTFNIVEADGLHHVGVDNREIGAIVARHFKQRQLKNLYFVGPKEHHHAKERFSGFREAVLKTNPEANLTANWLPAEKLHKSGSVNKTYRAFLERISLPAGVFCATDRIAYGFESLVLEQGLKVPSDLSIVGCNNDDVLCRLAPIPLSSVDESAMEVGFHAAAMLDQLFRQPGEGPRTVFVPPSGLCVRASSDHIETESTEMEAAIRYIREHISDGIYVPDVLKAVSISRRSLEMHFQKAFGHGVYEEILRSRIRRARELLRETELDPLDIVRESGFNNVARFDASFRKFTGTTPLKYRFRKKNS